MTEREIPKVLRRIWGVYNAVLLVHRTSVRFRFFVFFFFFLFFIMVFDVLNTGRHFQYSGSDWVNVVDVY